MIIVSYGRGSSLEMQSLPSVPAPCLLRSSSEQVPQRERQARACPRTGAAGPTQPSLNETSD